MPAAVAPFLNNPNMSLLHTTPFTSLLAGIPIPGIIDAAHQSGLSTFNSQKTLSQYTQSLRTAAITVYCLSLHRYVTNDLPPLHKKRNKASLPSAPRATKQTVTLNRRGLTPADTSTTVVHAQDGSSKTENSFAGFPTHTLTFTPTARCVNARDYSDLTTRVQIKATSVKITKALEALAYLRNLLNTAPPNPPCASCHTKPADSAATATLQPHCKSCRHDALSSTSRHPPSPSRAKNAQTTLDWGPRAATVQTAQP